MLVFPNSQGNACFDINFQVDETDVETVHTFNPSSQRIEEYSYPKAGTKNALSSLKLVEFSFSENGEVSSITWSLPLQSVEYFNCLLTP